MGTAADADPAWGTHERLIGRVAVVGPHNTVFVSVVSSPPPAAAVTFAFAPSTPSSSRGCRVVGCNSCQGAAKVKLLDLII